MAVAAGNAVQASREFATRLSRTGIASPPEFFAGTYSEALRQASRDSRPVLLYLHSDLHSDSEEFVRDIIFTDAVKNVIRQNNLIVWAGNVHDLDGSEAAARFGVTAYPFAAVCVPASTSRTGQPQYAKIWSCAGLPALGEFVSSLEASVGRYTTQVEVERAEQAALMQERELAHEQDRAYEAAVARDQERMRALEEERKKAAEDEARKLAEQAQAEEQAELEAAITLSKTLDKEGIVEVCRRRVAGNPEPPAGPGIATLRLQLPNGTKLQRRFKATDELRLVKDFVTVSSADLKLDVILGVDVAFNLASSFPKRTFDTSSSASQDVAQTLQAAGLAPSATLLVTLAASS